MPANVEIKARVRDINNLRRKAEEVSDEPGKILRQRDVFFKCNNSRLKLRVVNGEAELLAYQRADKEGPKLSNYKKTSGIRDPDALRETLAMALGEIGCVSKIRTLYMCGNVRVHVDVVENLGDFCELEVCLSEKDTVEEGEQIAHKLMKKLGIEKGDLIEVAYIDLLKAKSS